ncbi:MAG: LptE family protein [Bacteroidales bacterium]|nr:LptE family protein [Bacteroidales bacterium]
MMKCKTGIFILLFLFILDSGCTVKYSFTGASISPDTKTFSVKYFPNHAPLVNPMLSQEFTEALKDKFISQTSLNLVSEGGDLQFEGDIERYETKPMAIRGDDQTALTRFTIGVKVKFTNLKDPSKNFESNFSQYEDYDSEKSLDEVEAELVDLIMQKIIEDIFNKAVVNW